MSEEQDWYQDAIFYELRIRSFFDSDGDGVGDLKGLAQKLDYLQDLGVTTLWLLPFYPSPLRDDGYDTSDYTTVHPATGTLKDFKVFLKEAHRRGLRVVTELVLNHTSDQHPWFKRARKAAPGSRERDFYVWSDDPKRYSEARVIFQDFETSNWTWDPLANAYFWHRFYSHQPDLNFDNLEVQKAMLDVVDHWFEMGVDGLRLDAVPYLFEREGTGCENLPETHGFLKKLRAHVDRKFKGRMLLAEANQWPEDAVTYFGNGDECHMAFHFPIMPRLFMALRMEDRFPLIDILDQTPVIPSNCQWAIFLRNHDELTLEMVTDEERDYMVDAYAANPSARINLGIRRRLAPLLENNRRRIELMNALLFSMPGTPVLYYGDEIGMGDNVYLGDRDGVRTPMQWSPDRNGGFSNANPQRLILPVVLDPEYHYEAVNVETQQGNPSSLLWWTKRLIALRKRYRAFGRGTLEPLSPANRRVLAFIRRYEGEALLIVANLSRFAQYVELDLGEFKGLAPLELYGMQSFPLIGDLPYLLTLGPHNFFWFALRTPSALQVAEPAVEERTLPVFELSGSFADLFLPRKRAPLERLLVSYLPSRRWFRSKARNIKHVRLRDHIGLGERSGWAELLFVAVEFSSGDPELYVLPLKFVPGEAVPEHTLAILNVGSRRGEGRGALVDASSDPKVAFALLDVASRRRRLKGDALSLHGVAYPALREEAAEQAQSARALGAEQTNSSYAYGERFVGKLLRRLDEGESIELEVLRHLSQVGGTNTPALHGYIEVESKQGKQTLCMFQDFIANQGDAWTYTVDEVQRYFERIVTQRQHLEGVPATTPRLIEGVTREPPESVRMLLEGYLIVARQLAQRTGELHLALASASGDGAFAPERFTSLTKRSFYQSLRNLSSRSFDLLKERMKSLSGDDAELGRQVLRRERELTLRLKAVLERPLGGVRMRVHGDYHLGQVLHTGKDFVIIDFEGEPARSPSERRRRRSPIADVAGVLRSFHYAVYGVLTGALGQVRPEDRELGEEWADVWYRWVAASFLDGYLASIRGHNLLPEQPSELGVLLDVHLLEKALYELAYELNNRPSWVSIPLRGILATLDAAEQ